MIFEGQMKSGLFLRKPDEKFRTLFMNGKLRAGFHLRDTREIAQDCLKFAEAFTQQDCRFHFAPIYHGTANPDRKKGIGVKGDE